MSVLTVIWAAPLLGAALFAAAGFFAARSLSSREVRARHEEEQRAAEEQVVRLSQAELQFKQTGDQLASARAETERMQRALAERTEAEQQVRRLLEEQKRDGEEQKAEVARLQREVDLLARTRGELARVEKELHAAKRRASQLEAQKPEGDAQATKKIVELATMVSTLRRELEGETKRTAALQADNERLRESAQKSGPHRKGDGEHATPGQIDGHSLQQFVDDIMRSPSVSAAALTDELGFLVAGNGDHTEALAAFGAYLTEAGARACGLLPMHAVQRVSVQDDWGITLTARTVATAPNELVLVTLGVEAGRAGELSAQRERTA